MVGVSTSLGAHVAHQAQNRPAVEQAEVSRVQPTAKADAAPDSPRTDQPSQAFQLSENAQGVVVQASEGARTEPDSSHRQVVEQLKTELVQFFTDLYHRDFGYTVADATRKAHRIVGKAEAAIQEMGYQMTQRIQRSDVNQSELAYMVHVEVMNLQSHSDLLPRGADPEALLPNAGPAADGSHEYSRLRDTKVAMHVEARHQSGTPSFVEPLVIGLLDDNGAHDVEPLIDLSSEAWSNRVSSAQTDGSLQLHLGRTITFGVGQVDEPQAEDLLPGHDKPTAYDVVA